MKLRANHWREWYWQYFAIIEVLSEATWYKLDIDSILVISNLYNFDKLLISYLFELELLVQDDKYFRSPSLLKRMALKDDKKTKQSIWWVEAMRKRRWEQESDKLLITSKVKEIKVKETKEEKEAKKSIQEIEETNTKNNFKQKARAVETKWNYIIKLRNEKTWRNDMMEQATFNSLLNLIYNLDTDDFKKRVDKFIFIKKFIINSWVDKYLRSKIQRYDITMFLKNINMFATDDKGIIASICEKEYVSKVSGMYKLYYDPCRTPPPKWDPVPMKTVVPLDPVKAKEVMEKFRKNFWKK